MLASRESRCSTSSRPRVQTGSVSPCKAERFAWCSIRSRSGWQPVPGQRTDWSTLTRKQVEAVVIIAVIVLRLDLDGDALVAEIGPHMFRPLHPGMQDRENENPHVALPGSL